MYGTVLSALPAKLLALAEARGLSPKRLLAGTGFDRRRLGERGERVPWDGFTRLLDRIAEGLGGPEALAGFASLVDEDPAARVVTGLEPTPSALYRTCGERIGRTLVAGVGFRLEPRPRGVLRLEAAVPDDWRPSLPFFHFVAGAWRALAPAAGFETAAFEARVEERRVTAVIRLARAARLPRPKRRPPAPLTSEELLETLELARGEAGTAATASLVGELLGRQGDPLAVGRTFCEAARTHLCARRVRVWMEAPAGAEIPLAQIEAGRPGKARLRSVPVRFAGRQIARVEIDLPQHTEPPELLEELLAWLGLALDRWARTREPGAEASERIADRARAWRLSARQREVLELLVGGRANKEIAQALSTGEKAVEGIVSRILAKAKASSRAELVASCWADEPPDPLSERA